MTSKVLCLVVAAAGFVFQGCASDEPRELGRDGEDVGSVEEGDWNGEGQKPTDSQTASNASQGQLDGKTFQVNLIGKEDGKNVPTQLIFKDGKLESTACRQYGCEPAAYQVTTGEGG